MVRVAEVVLKGALPLWILLKVGFILNLSFILYTVVKYS